MEKIIAKSYIRLIEAGRRTLEDVPANIIEAVRELAPELFEEGEE